MNKRVTITIEVPMKCEQANGWEKSSDYFNESVREALEDILDEKIKNKSGTVETDDYCAHFKVNVITHSGELVK